MAWGFIDDAHYYSGSVWIPLNFIKIVVIPIEFKGVFSCKKWNREEWKNDDNEGIIEGMWMKTWRDWTDSLLGMGKVNIYNKITIMPFMQNE